VIPVKTQKIIHQTYRLEDIAIVTEKKRIAATIGNT